MGNLISKKFFMALASALLLVFVEGLGWNLPTDAIMGFVAIVLGYIFGQGTVDAVNAFKNGSK